MSPTNQNTRYDSDLPPGLHPAVSLTFGTEIVANFGLSQFDADVKSLGKHPAIDAKELINYRSLKV